MVEFFAPATAPFAVALCLTLALAGVELLGLLFGFGMSEALDGVLPDFDLPEGGGAGAGLIGPWLGWLSFGRVPALAVVILFASSFGLAGFIEQQAMARLFGFMLEPLIAAIPAAIAAAFATRWLGRLLARIVPRDESEAVSTTGFVGRVATVIRGEARSGFPAEAKLKDAHGKTHYLLVEPDEPEQSFPQGSQVVIVRQNGGVYHAITKLRPI